MILPYLFPSVLLSDMSVSYGYYYQTGQSYCPAYSPVVALCWAPVAAAAVGPGEEGGWEGGWEGGNRQGNIIAL